ncbi:MAG: TAT-variant-translocated molybdopterin oxidoreductase, partial [Calditrichaeota bacterium]|nr:TAT-variant-translocated molybdopterin oxidoreductase [Calditrichota bacterium]
MTRKNTRRYWSTLEEYEQLEQVEKLKTEEFFSKPESVLGENSDEDQSGLSRRDFLKVSGAAAVISMVACSERPVEKIIPYVNAPEEITPGLANYYATSSDVGNAPVVVKTREGRPILIDKNDLDVTGATGLTARASASIYDLYDPARARFPMQVGRKAAKAASDAVKIDWATADNEIATSIAGSGGEVVLLTGTLNGPSRKKLVADFLSTYPSGRHIQVDAFSNDDLRQANLESFAIDEMPSYSFAKADYMVFLGGDVLADSRDLARNSGEIAKTRRFAEDDVRMSRIVSFEPTMTEIGMLADYRYMVKNEDMAKVAYALVNEILPSTAFANQLQIRAAVGAYTASSVEESLGLKSGVIKTVAENLIANKSKSIVYAEGLSNQTKNGKALHVAVNCLNAILSNLGATVDFEVSTGNQSNGSIQALADLVADMNNGKVGALFVYGTNPSYFYHDATAFENALKNVKTLVSLNDRLAETSINFDYLLPSTHILESWGDREFVKGKYSIVQPTIAPIWDNRSFEESLMSIASQSGSSAFKSSDGKMISMYDYLRNVWRAKHRELNIIAPFEKFWVSLVRDGILDVSKNRYSTYSSKLSFNPAAFSGLQLSESTGMTLSIFQSSTIGDGSQNNNAYLLELPHPVSKICWDNYVSMSFATGRKLGININDVVTVTVNSKKITAPVNLQPGQHHDVITLAAGWGRTAVGRVGDGEGVNAFTLSSARQFSGLDVQVAATGETHRLVNVQGHQYLDDKVRFTELHNHHDENYRPVVFEASINEYKENPKDLVKYHTEALTEEIKGKKLDNMWGRNKENFHKYPGHHWGMT